MAVLLCSYSPVVIYTGYVCGGLWCCVTTPACAWSPTIVFTCKHLLCNPNKRGYPDRLFLHLQKVSLVHLKVSDLWTVDHFCSRNSLGIPDQSTCCEINAFTHVSGGIMHSRNYLRQCLGWYEVPTWRAAAAICQTSNSEDGRELSTWFHTGPLFVFTLVSYCPHVPVCHPWWWHLDAPCPHREMVTSVSHTVKNENLAEKTTCSGEGWILIHQDNEVNHGCVFINSEMQLRNDYIYIYMYKYVYTHVLRPP